MEPKACDHCRADSKSEAGCVRPYSYMFQGSWHTVTRSNRPCPDISNLGELPPDYPFSLVPGCNSEQQPCVDVHILSHRLHTSRHCDSGSGPGWLVLDRSTVDDLAGMWASAWECEGSRSFGTHVYGMRRLPRQNNPLDGPLMARHGGVRLVGVHIVASRESPMASSSAVLAARP